MATATKPRATRATKPRATRATKPRATQEAFVISAWIESVAGHSAIGAKLQATVQAALMPRNADERKALKKEIYAAARERGDSVYAAARQLVSRALRALDGGTAKPKAEARHGALAAFLRKASKNDFAESAPALVAAFYDLMHEYEA